jgi:hypothetical protein
MVGTTRWRLGVGAMITMTVLAGCGKGAGTAATSTPTGGAAVLGTAPPSTDATPPTTDATTTRPATAATNPLDVGYPSKAGDYAVAFMRAVSAANNTRLDSLAEHAAVLQATGGHPKLATGWAMYSCSSVQPDNTIGCTVRNDVGDDARVTLRASQLGHPTAVTDVQLDLTQYPSDAGAYVRNLITARGNGNKQRVARLSTSSMFDKLDCQLGTGLNTAVAPIDASTVRVTFSEGGNVLLERYQFAVLANPGGKANAVKELLKKTCSP